ncbi:Uncharacterized protein ALO64_02366 [Pseudomonas meliae]|uniref:Uncharacterized protein n=1 Tax=Pseudomonas meliae TaxID=86176 RepID=A0A0P9ZQV4_9PSED|nr:Uncharacterized protein ALO64_02366 [Pseudomonas meliae]
MKLVPKLLAAAVCFGLASQATAATELKHWPEPAAKALDAMIAANANKGNYAVFDMDNTSYRFDLEESLLPYMENKGLITRETLDPSLKLIPFKDTADHKESLLSPLRNRRHGLLPVGRAGVFRLYPAGAQRLCR